MANQHPRARAVCAVCGRDDIIVLSGTWDGIRRLRKHKPNVFRARTPDGYRVSADWCEGSGRPASTTT